MGMGGDGCNFCPRAHLYSRRNRCSRLVSSRREMASADIVFDALNSTQCQIKLFFVTDDEVQSASRDMITTSTHAKSVSGTMKIRQIHSSVYGIVRHKMLSCYCSDKYSPCNCFESTLVDFAVRKFLENRPH